MIWTTRHILGVSRPFSISSDCSSFQLLCFWIHCWKFLLEKTVETRDPINYKLVPPQPVRQWWIVLHWLRPFNEQNQLGEISYRNMEWSELCSNWCIRRTLNCTEARRVRCLFLEVNGRSDVTNVTAIISIENFIGLRNTCRDKASHNLWSIRGLEQTIRFNHRQGNINFQFKSKESIHWAVRPSSKPWRSRLKLEDEAENWIWIWSIKSFLRVSDENH